MKKGLLTFLISLAVLGSVFAEPQKLDLDKAITSATKEIKTHFKKKEFKKKNVMIAVVVSMTDSEDMANYLSNSFESEIKSGKNIHLVARDKVSLGLRQAEINYQYSGYVSDANMVLIGQEVGAQYIVNVGFEQIEQDRRLTVKTVDVKTSEIVVGTNVYSILDSKKLNSLLQNTKKLVVLSDYLDEIKNWQNQKRSTENSRDQEIVDTQGAITKEYQEKIAEANQQKYPENYSDNRIQREKSEKIRYLESERDTKLADAKKTISAKYAAGIKTCEDKKENVIDLLLRKEFYLRGQEQIFFSIDNFERNSVPQYFPVAFKSQDANVNYNEDFKITIKQDDTEDYNRINNPKKEGKIVAQLMFKVERIKGTDEFNVRVRKVALIHTGTNAELFSEEPNKIVNQVPLSKGSESASNTSDGQSDVIKSVSEKNEFKEDPRAEYARQRVKEMIDGEDFASKPVEKTFIPATAVSNIVINGETFDRTGEVLINNSQLKQKVIFGKYEVTQKLYEMVMENNPSSFKGQQNLPVCNMTWFEAVAFCNELTKLTMVATNCVYYSNESCTVRYTVEHAKAKHRVYAKLDNTGFRLPSSDEWEVAAGRKFVYDYFQGNTYYFETKYSGSDNLSDIAWWKDNSGDYYNSIAPHVVGTKFANQNGIYDMTGNVWEWAWSEFNYIGDNYSYDTSVPIKGGCFYNSEKNCSLNWWANQRPEVNDRGIGFRICRTTY